MDLIPRAVITLVILHVAAGEILEGPKDAVYRNNVNANATLTCKVQTPLIEGQSLYWKVNGSVIYGSQANTSTNIEKYRYSYDAGVFRMMILKLNRNDSNVYSCQYGFGIHSKTAKLTVADPPGEPAITGPSTLVEKVTAKFECSSSGGYPAPTFVWKKASTLVPESDVTKVDGGESTSEISVQLTKEDNGKELVCEVINDLQEVKNTSLLLNVKFKPSVSLKMIGRELAAVERGKGFTLSCNVESNPNLTSVEWKKDEQSLANSNSLILEQPDGIEDDTKYACVVTNPQGSSTSTLDVAVHYAPNVTIQEGREVSVTEGERLVLTCMAEAMPPQVTYKWIRGNDESTIITTSNKITREITRENAGTYTCIAYNELLGSMTGSGNSSIEVYVNYAPDQPVVVISPEKASKIYRAGGAATFTCTGGAGNPVASYAWFKNGADINHNESQLVIDVTTYNDTGSYECVASNIIGTKGSPPLNATFEDVPEFVSSSPSELNMTKGSTDSFLRCEYRGLPEPKIEWYYEETPVEQLHQYSVEHIVTPDASIVYKTTVSTLKFQGVNRAEVNEEDTGRYSCRAHSSVGKSQRQQTFTVTVLFGPEFQGFRKSAASEGSEAILTCEVIGSPAASSIIFLQNGQEIETNNSLNVSDVKQIDHTKYYQQKRTITFHRVRKSDYHNFTCRASSSLATKERILTLQPPGQPDSPTDLHLVEKSWDSLSIEWRAGFDGGRAQSFMITANGILTETQSTSITLKELLPSTSYSVEVAAKNMLGNSESVATMSVQTDFLDIPTPMVTYNKDDSSLTVTLNSTEFCVVILAKDDGDAIKLFNGECHAVSQTKTFQLKAPLHSYYMAQACVINRHKVCSKQATTDKVVVKDEMMYIVIGVVSGLLLLILIAAVVSYIIVRRHRNKKSSTKSNSPPISNGHINQVMEADEIDGEPAYATYIPPNNNLNATTSFSPPRSPSSNNTAPGESENLDYVYAAVQKKPTAKVKYLNTFNDQQDFIPPPIDDGFVLPMQRMDSPPNESNSDNTEQDTLDELPVFQKDSYLSLIPGGDSQPYARLSNTCESGYSTPDSRAKKVIYEVIV